MNMLFFRNVTNIVLILFQERMFIFWFNTYFVKCGYTPDKPDGGGEKNIIEKNDDGSELRNFSLSKEDLDKANKDKKHKIYPPDFHVSTAIIIFVYSELFFSSSFFGELFI